MAVSWFLLVPLCKIILLALNRAFVERRKKTSAGTPLPNSFRLREISNFRGVSLLVGVVNRQGS